MVPEICPVFVWAASSGTAQQHGNKAPCGQSKNFHLHSSQSVFNRLRRSFYLTDAQNENRTCTWSVRGA